MKNLDLTLTMLTYEGAASNDPADAIKVRNRIQETEITEVSRNQLVVADSTTDQAVTLPDDEIDYLVILVDREVTIKLNGSTDALTLSPRANGTKTWAFFSRGPVTELSVSNASGAAVNIDVIAATL